MLFYLVIEDKEGNMIWSNLNQDKEIIEEIKNNKEYNHGRKIFVNES